MAAEQDLFFDWNAAHAAPDRLGEALVLDETLRDGIQSPSALDPRIEEKIEILHLLDELGVVQLDLGLPGAGPHPRAAVQRMVHGDPPPPPNIPAHLAFPQPGSAHATPA